jgi:hypothetical protein
MLTALTTLALAAAPTGAAVTQAQLDRLVHKCAAEKGVRFVAQSRTEVIMQMLHVERAPTASENRRFECVLAGMKKMRSVQFFFIGNAAPSNDH